MYPIHYAKFRDPAQKDKLSPSRSQHVIISRQTQPRRQQRPQLWVHQSQIRSLGIIRKKTRHASRYVRSIAQYLLSNLEARIWRCAAATTRVSTCKNGIEEIAYVAHPSYFATSTQSTGSNRRNHHTQHLTTPVLASDGKLALVGILASSHFSTTNSLP